MRDIGPIRIPVLPQWIKLRDRADDTIWLLSFNGTHISLTDENTTSTSPTVDTHDIGDLRVFARNGRLGIEPDAFDVAESPTYTNKIGSVFYEVKLYQNERLSYEAQ